MGFKLGKRTGPKMTNGTLRTKMTFSQEAGSEASVPGTPVIRKPLAPNVMGEANMDGTIYISDKIIPNSQEEAEVINHEMRHATDMKVGKLSYGDNFVQYNGEIFPRETINGKDMVKIDGEWKEAGSDFPWENDANNGNKQV
jgi:hypothetical protein